MQKRSIFAIAVVAALLPLFATSCLDDDTVDYSEYQPVTPAWAPYNTIYMKWETDRSLTVNNLMPMANSTVDCIYEVSDIDGVVYDKSYSSSNTDSIFTCTPQNTIIGFEIALLNMHEGDSVSVIIPYYSGYGYTGSGSIPPYSNLIYKLKLKKVQDLLRPNV